MTTPPVWPAHRSSPFGKPDRRDITLGCAGAVAVALALLVSAFPTPSVAAAESMTEAGFLAATIRIEQHEPGRNQTIQELIACLRRFNGNVPETASQPPLRIDHPSASVFRITATLRSETILHFQILGSGSRDYAVLTRVEYKTTDRGFVQITDTEAKRLVVTQVCRQVAS